jgi:hypothetical protein
MDTKCYDTFWGDWRFLIVDYFLVMKKLHDAWVCRVFYSQSICCKYNCILMLWLYSSIMWRLYWRSWAMYNHKWMPGNIAVQDIWWLLPPVVSPQNENHVTCVHHVVVQGLAAMVKILISAFSTRVSWHTAVLNKWQPSKLVDMERWGVRECVCAVELLMWTGSIIETQCGFHHEMNRHESLPPNAVCW